MFKIICTQIYRTTRWFFIDEWNLPDQHQNKFKTLYLVVVNISVLIKIHLNDYNIQNKTKRYGRVCAWILSSVSHLWENIKSINNFFCLQDMFFSNHFLQSNYRTLFFIVSNDVINNIFHDGIFTFYTKHYNYSNIR